MIGIYKITSPSGKVYIGQSINIEERWYKYNKFETGKKAITLLNIDDKTMSNPNQRYINTLFNNYGQKAAKDLVKKLIKWQEKIEWR